MIKPAQQGFNLLEVLLVLLLVALVSQQLWPSYLALREKNLQTAEVNRVFSLINQLRLLASLHK